MEQITKSEFNIDFLDFAFIEESQKAHGSCIHRYIIQKLRNDLNPTYKKINNNKTYLVIIKKKDICMFITHNYHLPTILIKSILKEMEFYKLIKRINKQFFEITI